MSGRRLMNDLYLSGIGFIDGVFLPLFYILDFALVLVPDDTTGLFDFAVLLASWVVFFHNTDIFPVFFFVTADILLLSFFVSLFMRLVRWIMSVIPFV